LCKKIAESAIPVKLLELGDDTKHFVEVIRNLMAHLKSEQDFIDQQTAQMGNPDVAKALVDYREQFVNPRFDELKAILEARNPEVVEKLDAEDADRRATPLRSRRREACVKR
jgi:hypothetical protein